MLQYFLLVPMKTLSFGDRNRSWLCLHHHQNFWKFPYLIFEINYFTVIIYEFTGIKLKIAIMIYIDNKGSLWIIMKKLGNLVSVFKNKILKNKGGFYI